MELSTNHRTYMSQCGMIQPLCHRQGRIDYIERVWQSALTWLIACALRYGINFLQRLPSYGYILSLVRIPVVLQCVPWQWEVLTVVTSLVLPWPCARQSRATAWYTHRQGQHPTAATHAVCHTPEQQSSHWRMGDWTTLHLVSVVL